MSSPCGLSFKRKKCVVDYPISFIDINLLGCWRLENIAKAGKLLRKPPLPVQFDDEHEMRKVYSLIYDVFRYKHVMSQALNDVSFYAHYPQLSEDYNRVWLLLFELYVRHFQKRCPEETELQYTLFKQADLEFISKGLWAHRVHLAAAISRLRIKSGALHLSELLPNHLQNEKVAIAAANPIVTGWINPFKLKDKMAAIMCLEKMGLTEVKESEESDESSLRPNQYKWDKVCPLFMSCIPGDRGLFAQSELVKNNYFVMQDRTFSFAPAIISRLLDYFDLDGDVVQTHVSSPRSTAYLAALFHSVNRVHDFIAFGAGSHLKEYTEYIKNLGVNNIRLYAENFCNLSLESSILGTVVGIFATPPNSYSGVADPIDLICSRGGDLSMLEVLTESEISRDGKKRVAQLLEEQRDTLRLSMSRPQIQFILYETHSIVGSENQDMVNRAVEDINRCAFEKHLLVYKERKRLEALAELEGVGIPGTALTQTLAQRRSAGISATSNKPEEVLIKFKKSRNDSVESLSSSNVSNIDTARKSGTASSDDLSQSVKVPKTDEFLSVDVPDICMNKDKCVNFHSLGCYVSLIRRKQITKLDAKYLIKMAESRGLFGSSDQKKNAKPKSSKRQEKRTNKVADSSESKKFRTKKTDVATLIERLNQPTHSSLNRSPLHNISPKDYVKSTCDRHGKHHSREYPYNEIANPYMSTLQLDSRAKRWWRETTSYVNALRLMQCCNKKHYDGETTVKIKNPKFSLAQIYSLRNELPAFHLSRTHNELYTFNQQKRMKFKSVDRIPYPISINHLEFKAFGLMPNNKSGNLLNYPLFKQKEIFPSKRPSIHSYPKPLGYYLYTKH